MKPTRVLIIAHGHPDFSRGGAEQAAYDEFQALKGMPGIEPCLLARAPLGMGHGGTPFSVHREPGAADRRAAVEAHYDPPTGYFTVPARTAVVFVVE